ncbi:MAG: LecA/PA-IL family lectin [Pyrinomonadaceae bacterium]
MSVISKSLRFIGSLVLTVSLGVAVFADTVRLKDGSIIKGRIVSFDNGKFVVAIGEGSRRRELTFLSSEIESIQFDSPTGAPASVPSNRNASYKDPVSNPPGPVRVIVSGDPGVTTIPQPRPNSSGGKLKPIEWTVKVLADNTANGWTNSGWVVKKGQRVRITGDGKVLLGKGQSSSPSGIASLDDQQKLLKNVPTGALIAVIGDDNNDFIYVGSEREFVATRDGALFLGINEGNLDDNSGAFSVKIEIIPGDEK